jgi:hypothetical protein
MPRSLAIAIGVVLLLAAGVLAFVLRPGHALSPEEAVRAAVQRMEQGLSDKDASRVMDPVSEAFHSQTLGDRTELKRMVLAQLMRGGALKVVTLQADVVPGENGRLLWQGRVAAAQAGGAGLATVTDAELRQFHVEAAFAEEQGQWRLVAATVTPVE